MVVVVVVAAAAAVVVAVVVVAAVAAVAAAMMIIMLVTSITISTLTIVSVIVMFLMISMSSSHLLPLSFVCTVDMKLFLHRSSVFLLRLRTRRVRSQIGAKYEFGIHLDCRYPAILIPNSCKPRHLTAAPILYSPTLNLVMRPLKK